MQGRYVLVTKHFPWTAMHAKWTLIVSVLTLHCSILAFTASRLSPTSDEPAHLVSGLYHWNTGRFHLYCVNPPLVRLVAVLPLLRKAKKLDIDWTSHTKAAHERPEFVIGQSWLRLNGHSAVELLTFARWACIPFSFVGAVICYRWSREFWDSETCGLVSLILWCFDPNLLAHGSLITPDCAATSLGLGAGYWHWRWTKLPTTFRAITAGCFLGMALLTKTTWIVLFLLFPMFWVAFHLIVRSIDESEATRKIWRESWQLVLILVVGLVCLNAGYGFRDSFCRLGDFHFQSKFLSSLTEDSEWIEAIVVPVPRDYLTGLDVQKTDFDNRSGRSYLRGEWRSGGWWYYYFYAFAVKTPLGSLLLVTISCFSVVVRLRRGARFDSFWAFSWFVIAGYCVCVFLMVSCHLGFNRHLRYVLPAWGFLFTLAGGAGYYMAKMRRKVWRITLTGSVVCGVTWISVATSLTIPHQSAYFNELAGGMKQGHRHLLSSNLDWGEKLISLDDFLSHHPDTRKVAIAYSGAYDPEWLGIRVRNINWYHEPTPLSGFSHVAIGANLLCGDQESSYWYRRPRPTADEFEGFFKSQEPVAIVGGSIFIYRAQPYVKWYLSHLGKDVMRSERPQPFSTQVSLQDSIKDNELGVSDCLHILQLNGLGPTGMNAPASGAEALRYLLDDRVGAAVFGESPLVHTRHGIRYKLVGSPADNLSAVGETHRDQCLAVFAALKLPLSTPLHVGGSDCQLACVLNDSIANFSFHQSELPWTLHAYAHYLPPRKDWTNRLERKFSFSEIVNESLERGLNGQSCAGLHVIASLAALNAADDQCSLLNKPARSKLRLFLRTMRQRIRDSQFPDGSWDRAWAQPRADSSAAINNGHEQCLITGHMVELLLKYFPDEDNCIDNGRTWLHAYVTQYGVTNTLSACTLTHALWSLGGAR